MFPLSFKCSLEFPNVPLEFHVFPWVPKCSPWVSLSSNVFLTGYWMISFLSNGTMFPFSFKCSLDFPNVPLDFQCVHLSSQVFHYVPMGSLDFPWVSKCSLEFPCVPLSFLEFTSVPLSSQMFPLSGTFVSCCMNRGCLLGVWMIPFLSKWYICCMLYEQRLLTGCMNDPIFVKVVHLLHHVWTEVAYWVYEWSHFCQSVVHLLHDVWTEVAYWVYEWPHFCQSGTFVAS